MRHLIPHKFIFSCYKEFDNAFSNENRHNRMLNRLQSSNPLDCVGSFNGIEEKSIMLIGSKSLENTVLDLASESNQTCILSIDNDNHAELVYKDGTRQSIGTWTEVDKTEVTVDFTKIGDRYFICK